MSLEVVLHPLAERDLVDTWEWYEQQLPGLGDRFVAAVGLAIERAARWPNAAPAAIHDDDGEVVERRVAPSGFPYVVRYRVVDARLVVMACTTNGDASTSASTGLVNQPSANVASTGRGAVGRSADRISAQLAVAQISRQTRHVPSASMR